MTGPVFLSDGEGRTFTVGPDKASVKVEAEGTGDAFSLVEYVAAPGVPGPPPHTHRVVSETFYILEGEVEFLAGDTVRTLARGAVAFVPPGVTHTFSNKGPKFARWIGIFSPGRYMALVEEVGKAFPAGGGPPDEAMLLKAFAEYDTEIVAE
jgi:quercetin dioxygenase-like cupin family protein